MRRIAILMLLLLAVSASAVVTNNNFDASRINSNNSAVSVTSTEQTFTFTKIAGSQPRYIIVIADQDIGWSDVTGTYANKFPIAGARSWTFKFSEDSKVYYVQAASTTASVHVYVLDAVTP